MATKRKLDPIERQYSGAYFFGGKAKPGTPDTTYETEKPKAKPARVFPKIMAKGRMMSPLMRKMMTTDGTMLRKK